MYCLRSFGWPVAWALACQGRKSRQEYQREADRGSILRSRNVIVINDGALGISVQN